MNPFLVSNDALDNPAELRARAQRDGYLFLRGVVDRDAIMAARRDIAGVLQRHGWLDDGTDPMDAISTREPVFEGTDGYWPVYDDVQRLESFHRLSHDPAIHRTLRTLFEEDVLAHPRNIARIIFPDTEQYAIASHQDYMNIGGTEDTWTAWVPLGDCPMELGSLVALSGSRHAGFLPRKEIQHGGVTIAYEPDGCEWVGEPFQMGDVLLFHSLTVHKALGNRTRDRIRLSVDMRYQPASHPVAISSLLPHYTRLTWDEVYAGWSDRELCYYWERQNPQVAQPVG